MWDPKSRPTSIQALQHEYFRDAVDPLLPKASAPSRMARKNSELAMKPSRDSINDAPHPTLEKKNSWFRKSFIVGRTDGVVSPPPTTNPDRDGKPRPEKRSTWHAPKISSGSGVANNGAPMMILPSIRPVSPLSDAVSVQAARVGRDENSNSTDKERRKMEEKAVKKIGRQLSVASTNSQHNGYINGTQQAADKLNGNTSGGAAVTSPTAHKESFFSHLRKRARRLSGRTGLPPSPDDEDLESGVGCGIAWGGRDGGSNRSSMLVDSSGDASGIDRAIKEVDAALAESNGMSRSNSASLRRNPSFPPTPNASRAGELSINGVAQTPAFPRTRRSVRNTKQRYETPDENDELVGEVLAAAAGGYDNYDNTPNRKDSNKDLRHVHATNGYPTPSPQTNHRYYTKGLDISGKMRRDDEMADPKWPTPPSEGDSGWGQHLYSMARR
jgi:meiosis induction protein kinase IME2/SME1